MRKTNNYLKKTKYNWKITSELLRGSERKKTCLWACRCFLQNLGITAHTLEDYSNLKSNFSFNNGSILEIHDYFRARENASFNDLSQLIHYQIKILLRWINLD